MSMDAPLPHGGPMASATGSGGIGPNGITPNGITHCLHLLAEDAVRLGLRRTHLAICQVVEICEAECIERASLALSGRGRSVL
jgi:hypothetical protein